MVILIIFTIITFIMTVRSVLVMLGTYKDPILSSFQRYGEEEVFSPPIAVLFWGTAFVYVSLFWYINRSLVFGVGLALVIPLGAMHGIVYQLIHKYKDILRKYPSWCDELIQMTDRDERRRIAYLWLFLPPSTRMVYNTNNHLFRQWVEQVLLTVSQ